MNVVNLTGRLVREPEVKYGNTIAVCRFTVAVNRPKKKGEKKAEADYISCICFGSQGEVLGNYMTKGSKIELTGNIRTGSYEDKSGKKVYTTDVVVDRWEFGESKPSGNTNNKASAMASMGTPFDEDISF